MLELVINVRLENMRGRLYWSVPCERIEMDALVRRGVVLEVPATPTSLGGYVAIPDADFDALIDSEQGI